MNSLYLLAPIAFLLVVIAVRAFFWAVDNDQFDDLDAAGRSILFDDIDEEEPESVATKLLAEQQAQQHEVEQERQERQERKT